MKNATDVTTLLSRIRAGDQGAQDEFMPQVYGVLREIAVGAIQRYGRRETLQPTALVHEAFLKMFSGTAADYSDRKHFLGVAAMAMRQLLVDHARAREAQKRGGGAVRGALDDVLVAFEETGTCVLDLHAALDRLAKVSPQGARVIEMRFFGGLNNDEVADVMGVSSRTVEREWRAARAWLYAALIDHATDDELRP